ncbi:hypothetical protein [Cohnella nanjingensis]|uniref:Uncharacterized protein n=1 Tax=Cohnella nanjingensis TaxID=1387779 RepID=A0A7X0RTC5_9BACL|nr:hypothetical protein [Cohnella nanjingensis]MBB6672030.1 hypothetical protein [Cohnella nanjingensis]
MKEQLRKAINNRVRTWMGWQLFLVILYPLSILQMILFWTRFSRHEHLKGKKVFIVALHFYGLTFFCAFGFLSRVFSSDPDDQAAVGSYVIIAIFVVAIGLILQGISKFVNNRKIELLGWYYQVAMNNAFTNVNQIAAYASRPVASVKLALKFMNEYGLLPVLVNEATGELLYDMRYRQGESTMEAWDGAEAAAGAETPVDSGPIAVDSGPITVECTGCGSKAQIYRNKAATCEYCSTPLN